ncbi:TIGR03087 family PEP-CTERM/XrtA system glycosyltransferase [Agaribacter flavus]|uniref:TIGR03087 family PEP-CTERM/XrtA system glycosyltransferase n=1 Tax=Agaribacter flavus TaxID=1902781 RepID=A0ABV7FQS4_9ALTE
MRILFVCQRLPFPPNKGEKLRTYHQIKYLQESGIDVEVLAPVESESELRDAGELRDSLGLNVYPIMRKFNVFNYMKGLLTETALSVAKFYDSEVQSTFERILSTVKIDSVIFSASSLTPYWWRMSQTTDIRAYCDFMDVDSDKWHQYAETAGFVMKWIYKREARLIRELEIKSCVSLERCFLIAEKELEIIANFLPDNASLPLAVGNGIDTSEFYPSERQSSFVLKEHSSLEFLFVGVMDYKPNVDAVLWFVENVWPQIVSKYPQARFRIVGMSPIPKVIKLADRKGIEVTGKVNDVSEYFRSADIFVAPFTIARGVQNKILQAMATGLPVITSSKGAEGINCKHRQDILIADEPDTFLASLDFLLEGDHFRTISQHARQKIVEEYSWEKHLQVFKQTITGELNESS